MNVDSQATRGRALYRRIRRALLDRDAVAGGELVDTLGVEHVVPRMATPHEAEARASRGIGLDVSAEVVADLVRPATDEIGEDFLDLTGSCGRDHAPSGAHVPDGAIAEIEVEVELVDGRRQVVLYVNSEKLGIVLGPRAARSLAADLERASDRILLGQR